MEWFLALAVGAFAAMVVLAAWTITTLEPEVPA
jgi:hypothetical protein